MRGLIFVFTLTIYLVHGVQPLKSLRLKSLLKNGDDPEIVGGSNHPCYRICTTGETLVCNYTFTLTQYTSMSYACRNCPIKSEDCFRDGCISAGGHVRPVTVANHMLPGPSIQVCEGDTVRVHVANAFASDSTTIHWHGIHQVGTPFMDGTPFVTQCPIPPHNSFEYVFKASPAGTHIWHAHIGFEEADGLHGSFIVRKSEDPMERYYDYDLAEHVMIIWHWYDAGTAFRLATALHTNSVVSGYGLLIDGLASKAKISFNDTDWTTPRKVFEVSPGKRYRFRAIFNSAVYCPVQISIDNHTMIVIASETGTFDPIEVESFIINGGERYDFVLFAKKDSGSYWIRYRGLGDCERVKVSEVAVLRYKNSKEGDPPGKISYEDANRSGVLLNPVQTGTNSYPDNEIVKIVELNNTMPNQANISGIPDHTFYFKFSFNTYDTYYAPGPYPQMNDLSFEYPAFPLLTENSLIPIDMMYCTEDTDTNKECVDGFCSCPIIYRAAKDSLVEIVLVDTSLNRDQDHPMHLHGNDFYVVSMETVGPNISLQSIQNLNEANMIEKKLIGASVKDTIGVPARGFTIIRFIASNPGYWFFHCHIANHAEMGMGVVLKVGEDDEMIKPSSNFPRCSPYGNELIITYHSGSSSRFTLRDAGYLVLTALARFLLFSNGIAE